MNRRNLLIGIGTAAVGSGAVLGSGALTQVQADREVQIGVNDDSSALLGLNPTDEVPEVSSSSDGEIQFLLPDNLNDEAVTTFGTMSGSSGNKSVDTAAFKISNGDAGSDSNSPALNISATVNGSNGTDILNFLTVDSDSNKVDLTEESLQMEPSDSAKGVIVEVDTADGSDYGSGSNDVAIENVTFKATTPEETSPSA
ncbi:hypothetical protein GOC74_07205 [Halomicrobium mukohataei]|uniref:DUF1102 domain-containing protein n=1 Tax=Halomicrobium mukohataei TaxID=57705 RepID=A0A847U8P4_9EURY|nr:hypothetical protein [Halomicrobium mukohataei]NLV09715.1 hypothetical protein [Halomicrobium mukohataei]